MFFIMLFMSMFIQQPILFFYSGFLFFLQRYSNFPSLFVQMIRSWGDLFLTGGSRLRPHYLLQPKDLKSCKRIMRCWRGRVNPWHCSAVAPFRWILLRNKDISLADYLYFSFSFFFIIGVRTGRMRKCVIVDTTTMWW